jgi:hypothetical protein
MLAAAGHLRQFQADPSVFAPFVVCSALNRSTIAKQHYYVDYAVIVTRIPVPANIKTYIMATIASIPYTPTLHPTIEGPAVYCCSLAR